MNIEDVPVEGLFEKAAAQYGTKHPIRIIFARQIELIESYLKIEDRLKGERLWDMPVDLHSFEGQAALKERAWWFTEEIGEALDALVNQGAKSLKFGEEIGDALHFLTELCLMAGISEDDVIYSFGETFDWGGFAPPALGFKGSEAGRKGLAVLTAAKTLTDLAIGMWQLRNKSWKQTQVQTDIPRFRAHVLDAYDSTLMFARVARRSNLREICELYLRKSEVNLFRIRSRY